MTANRLIAALLVLAMVQAPDLLAASRTGAVYGDGSVRTLGSGPALMNQSDCDADPDLFFIFTETVSPPELIIEAGKHEADSLTVSVTIDLACRSGNATFDYSHQSDGPLSGAGFAIEPLNPILNVSLDTGSMASIMVGYSLTSAPLRSRIARLFHDRITFIADNTFGQTANQRQLASIRFLGDVLDSDVVGAFDQPGIHDAGLGLIIACRDANPGTPFADACEEIREHAISDQQQAQVANAFDAHGLAALVLWASEVGRIQDSNIANRLAELRMGQSDPNLNGFTLNINGRAFDPTWLSSALRVDGNGNNGESRLLGERWGAFLNGSVSVGDRSERGKEVGFDFDSWAVTGGVDFRFDNGVAGLAAGYSKFDADIEHDGGSASGDAWSLQLFGTYNAADNLYVDMIGGFNRIDFTQRRVVDLSGIGSLNREIAVGSTNADQWSASVSVNYRHQLGNALSITPYGKLYWGDVVIDGFSENSSVFAFDYSEQKFTSRILSAGLRASRPINLQRTVLNPYADLSWQYQGGIDAYTIDTMLTGTSLSGPAVEISDPDRNFARLDAGLSWVFPSGNQMFISYSALLFERDTSLHSIFVGARWEF